MLDPWGSQGCTAAFVTLFWPWPSLLPEEYLLQVFWNAKEKRQESRGWQSFRVPQDTDGNLVLSNSASVLLAHVGSYIVGNSSFCSSCKAEFISGNFSDPNLHPPEIPQISRSSAHLGIKKLSIYLVHSHLSGFWPKVKGPRYFLVSPFALAFYFGGNSEKAKVDFYLRRKGYITKIPFPENNKPPPFYSPRW